MSTPESKVRDPVVKWATANGFLHFRMSFRPGVRQGTPDDLFISPDGVHVWCEFKREGKEPTPLQMHRITTLLDHKVMAFWCNDKAEGIAALQRLLNASTLLLHEGPAQ
jgi:hypothetical protein